MKISKNTSTTRIFSTARLFGQRWIWLGPIRIVIR